MEKILKKYVEAVKDYLRYPLYIRFYSEPDIYILGKTHGRHMENKVRLRKNGGREIRLNR